MCVYTYMCKCKCISGDEAELVACFRLNDAISGYFQLGNSSCLLHCITLSFHICIYVQLFFITLY